MLPDLVGAIAVKGKERSCADWVSAETTKTAVYAMGDPARAAGELRDARQAAKLKAMGLQRGWPDFLLIAPGGRLHAIELKRQGERLSEDQEAFAEWCRGQGVPFACVDDLRDALATLKAWGALYSGS